MNLTKQIHAPVVPELVLTYTEEECAPLPPEVFKDNEDEGLEGDVDMAVEDGSGVKAAGDGVEAGVIDNTTGTKAADDGADVVKDNQGDAEGDNIELD